MAGRSVSTSSTNAENSTALVSLELLLDADYLIQLDAFVTNCNPEVETAYLGDGVVTGHGTTARRDDPMTRPADNYVGFLEAKLATEIGPHEAREEVEAGGAVIYVRSAESHAKVAIPGALRVSRAENSPRASRNCPRTRSSCPTAVTSDARRASRPRSSCARPATTRATWWAASGSGRRRATPP